MIFFNYLTNWDTPKAISLKLKQIYNEKFIDLTTQGVPANHRFSQEDVLLNYGISYGESLEGRILSAGGKILNSASAISNNCNKLFILEKMKELGLNVPKVWRNKREITKFPVLGRDRAHTRGEDIVVIRGNNDLRLNDYSKIPDKDYYIELIDKETEFRFYIYKEKVFKVFKKEFTGRDVRNNSQVSRQTDILNDNHGWEFRTIENPEYNVRNFAEMKRACIETAKAIKLETCSFDLAREKETEKAFIFEANSASWCGVSTQDALIKCIQEDIDPILNNNYRGLFSLERIFRESFF